MSAARIPLAPARPWIAGPRYDLVWFFGGALLSLAAVLLHLGLGVPILVVWWTWLLAFDGPHIAAAFTRTYLDRAEWRRRPGLLVGALGAFAIGPACLLVDLATGSSAAFTAFLAAAAFYGYYHVVRQHYGFLALYRTVEGERDRLDFRLDKWCLYVGCWAPYAYFLLTHPRARALLHLPAGGPLAALGRGAADASLLLWAGALGLFAVRAIALRRIRRPASAFVLVAVLLYGLAYLLVADFEPVYRQSRGPDQDFLLLSVMVTMFHNVQYVALVWFHNRNRYGSGAGLPASAGAPPRGAGHGPATTLARSLPLYLAACGLFSLVYLALACSTGVFAGCQTFVGARLGPFTASQLGLAAWWGLAIHHYYLDQRIWRIRGDAELARSLGLPPRPIAPGDAAPGLPAPALTGPGSVLR